MNQKINFRTLVFLLLLACIIPGCQGMYKPPEKGDTTKYYYALELNGTLCGYTEVSESSTTWQNKKVMEQEAYIHLMLELMDRQISTDINIINIRDSISGKVLYSEVDTKQGNVHIVSKTTIDLNKITIENSQFEKPKIIDAPEGTIVDNFLYSPHLVKSFIDSNLKTTTYNVLDEMKGVINKRVYTFEGFDTLSFFGKDYPVFIVSELIPETDIRAKSWIGIEDGFNLKNFVYGINREFYLSDYTVKKQIGTLLVDDVLFYSVNKVIPDFKTLEYMKIEVEIGSIGQKITEESLNYPGQVFVGAVEDNLISGIFEISSSKYDGTSAPVFPFDLEIDASFNKYLEPGEHIESNDPGITKKALAITEGSFDSWEAVVRLSQWVSNNIKGAIPGGGTAKGTFELREGECGGHSRLLAAMCRAAGIPARLSIGGMYVPDRNGFFGQHAWTEVYMGEAGWIAVDATIDEIDYIDAGHIRLGEGASFNPKEIKIIEYRTEEMAYKAK